jgi:quercetin dioxygenase-like cupin family protein
MAQSYWLFGTHLTVLADSGVSEGRYDLIEGQFPPGAQTPLHRHNRYVEQLYVTEGELTIWCEAQKVVLHSGDSFIIPAGAAHVVAATGNGMTKGLNVASPSGFARLIKEVGKPAKSGQAPPPPDAFDMALFERISAEIGDELLGPPGTLPTA